MVIRCDYRGLLEEVPLGRVAGGRSGRGRVPVDNSHLERWRRTDASAALCGLADYAKLDASFVPTSSTASTRWHASADGRDYEILCTGSKFFDTRAQRGGGGAIDLAMHLFEVRFKEAVLMLESKGL